MNLIADLESNINTGKPRPSDFDEGFTSQLVNLLFLYPVKASPEALFEVLVFAGIVITMDDVSQETRGGNNDSNIIGKLAKSIQKVSRACLNLNISEMDILLRLGERIPFYMQGHPVEWFAKWPQSLSNLMALSSYHKEPARLTSSNILDGVLRRHEFESMFDLMASNAEWMEGVTEYCQTKKKRKDNNSISEKEGRWWMIILIGAFLMCVGIVIAAHCLSKKNAKSGITSSRQEIDLPIITSSVKENDQLKYDNYQRWIRTEGVIENMVRHVLKDDSIRIQDKNALSSAMKLVALIRFSYHAPGARGDIVKAYGEGFASSFDMRDADSRARLAGQKLLDEFYTQSGDDWLKPIQRFNEELDVKASNPREAWTLWLDSIKPIQGCIEREKEKMIEIYDL